MTPFSKTKIVATVGPRSESKEMLTQLVHAGVNVFRLNFSHGTHEKHAAVIENIVQINQELGTNIGILADLQGPKIRIGEVENNEIILVNGQSIRITTKEQVSTPELLYISYESLALDVEPGDRILIDDGKLGLVVKTTNKADEITAEVIYGGILTARKGVNLPDTTVTAPSLMPKDHRDLEFIFTMPVNWIALSFVRTAEEINKLKGVLEFRNHPAKVIAKIEKPDAYKNLDEIIRVSDGIMVARGDLGVELPLEDIPFVQKDIVTRCIKAHIPVIIATQMMESMVTNAIPTRAEITDITNAMFDGADALMLSAETASGKYPVKVIETLKKVINKVEQEDKIYNMGIEPDKDSHTFLSDAVCFTACRMAKYVNATSIIALTRSGYTAFSLASFRPVSNIFVFTENANLLNAVSLVWGTRAYLYNRSNSTEDTVRHIQNILKDKGMIQKGEIVINTGSTPFNELGNTNTIKVSVIH
ncbi:MAG: pyruvate kinase [Sphingobacteriales bacterium]|nr:MAG: pyruvate kinase [Sphingobacteriales bacterium]